MADRALVNPQYKNWAPRVGLAYSLNPKTVIRSGYGISYVLFVRQGGDSYLAYNGPYVVNAQITQSPSQPLCGPNSPPLTCFRPTQLGYPDGFTSPANFSTVNTKTVYVQPDIRTPYVQNWHFTIHGNWRRTSCSIWATPAITVLACGSTGIEPGAASTPNQTFR